MNGRSFPAFSFLVLLLVTACGDSNSNEITHGSERNLSIFCMPAGANIGCRLFLNDRGARDVTGEATWLVTGPAVGVFRGPGLFVPTAQGDVGVWARYQDLFTAPPLWFFVNPPEPARVLLGLSGVVREEGTNAGIAGAEVRILDGHFAGTRVVTNSVGVYFLERILAGETFSMTASKVGYESSTRTLRVDYPVTPVNPDFLLRRLP
jgi:hypothetical protein